MHDLGHGKKSCKVYSNDDTNLISLLSIYSIGLKLMRDTCPLITKVISTLPCLFVATTNNTTIIRKSSICHILPISIPCVTKNNMTKLSGLGFFPKKKIM